MNIFFHKKIDQIAIYKLSGFFGWSGFKIYGIQIWCSCWFSSWMLDLSRKSVNSPPNAIYWFGIQYEPSHSFPSLSTTHKLFWTNITHYYNACIIEQNRQCCQFKFIEKAARMSKTEAEIAVAGYGSLTSNTQEMSTFAWNTKQFARNLAQSTEEPLNISNMCEPTELLPTPHKFTLYRLKVLQRLFIDPTVKCAASIPQFSVYERLHKL